jgi:hypothetical protein
VAAPVVEPEDGCLEREVGMHEWQKLQSDLKRYLSIRDRISDERLVAVIEELIREIENRLSLIKNDKRNTDEQSGALSGAHSIDPRTRRPQKP